MFSAKVDPLETKMPVTDTTALAARGILEKRNNWAGNNPGVVVVFAIVFVVAVGLLYLFISKKLAARREAKERHAARHGAK